MLVFSARCCTWLVPFAVCVVFLSAAAAASDADCLNSSDMTFLSFFPCLPSDDIANNGHIISCDVFAYAAAVLATEHANNDLLNINISLVPISTFTRALPVQSFDQEPFHDELRVDILSRITSQSFLSSLRGVLVPPSVRFARILTGFFSTRFINATVMGYGSTDRTLDTIPEFFRTIPSDILNTRSRLLLMKLFGWFRIGVINREGTTYTRLYNNFLTLFETSIQPGFEARITHASSYVTNPDEVLEQFRRHNLRIFVGYFGPEDAREVLCKASNNVYELTTSEHVWILPAYQQPDWWKLEGKAANSSNCSDEQMVDILNSVIFIGPNKFPPADISLGDFQLQLISKTRELFPSIPRDTDLTPYLLHSHAVSAYDAVRQQAKGISISLHCCQFQNQTFLQNSLHYDILGCEWCRLHYNCRNITDISYCALCPVGPITEPVCAVLDDQDAFTKANLEEHGQTIVSQFIDGVECPMGFFWSIYDLGSCNFVNISELEEHSCSRHLNLTLSYFNVSSSCPSDFYWKGRNSPPESGLRSVSFIREAYLIFSGILAMLLMALILAMLVFNILWRDNKIVKGSSPRLNIVMLIGAMFIMPVPLCIGLYTSVLYYNISEPAANGLCVLEVWIFFPSLMLFLAPLLLKNWRLYRIFYNKNLRDRGRFMTDKNLFGVTIIFVLPVLILLIAWTAFDTHRPRFDSYDIPLPNFRLVTLTFCSSKSGYYNAWFGTFVAYNLIIVILTFILSYLNSKVIRDFRKEGRVSQQALTVVLIMVFPIYVITTFFTVHFPERFQLYWWLHILSHNILTLVLLAILFVPNMVRVYKRNIAEKHKRAQSITTEVARTLSVLRAKKMRLQAELKQKEDRIQFLKEKRKAAPASGTGF